MRFGCLLVGVSLCVGSAGRALADQVMDPTGGYIAPTTTLTASATGDVTGYFLFSAAGGHDYVRLLDTSTGYASAFLLGNYSTLPGQSVSFGMVHAGDNLVFELVNSDVETTKGYKDFSTLGPLDPNAQTNHFLLSSDPAYSVDGFNHAYVTAFDGDTSLGIPAGTFVGMEDLPSYATDWDYNDTESVFTNVSAAAATPEPGSLLLMGSGLAAMWLPFRRRFRRA